MTEQEKSHSMLVVSLQHRDILELSRTTAIYFHVHRKEGDGEWVFAGFQTVVIPHVSDIRTKPKTTLSQPHLGLGKYSITVAMATLDSLSFAFLSHEYM